MVLYELLGQDNYQICYMQSLEYGSNINVEMVRLEFKDKNFNTFGQFSVWLAYFAYSSLIR